MIQIIDGFKLQTSTPIDSRIVVADDTERTSMSNKYHGLRVWQVDTNIPYFWNGTQWESELDLVVTGSGSINNVPKFSSSTPSILTDSQISDDGATVDISNNLLVGNDITFSGDLNGDLNAGNILSGSLDLDRLNTSSAGTDYVLQYDGTSPEWVDLNSISIGTSTNTDSIKVENVSSSNKYSLILRDEISTLGNFLPLYSYNSDLFFSEKSGSMCILAPDGSVSNPPYSFDGDTNTGMYRPSASVIGFSSNGNETVRMDTTGFKTILGSVTNPSISSFVTKNVTIGAGPSVSTQNLDDTGFYFDSIYYGPSYGPVKQLYFATNGAAILSLNRYGMNIYTTGTNQSPSISFTPIGNQSSGINGGSGYVSLVTGQTERFRVEGGSVLSQNSGRIYLHGNVNVEDNLYLPQPNSSSPSAGKVLTSFDGTGEVEWSDNPIALHAPDFVYQKVTSIAETLNTAQGLCSEVLKSDGKKYIIHVVAKVVASANSGKTNSSNTGWIQQKLKIDGDIKDTAQFHLWIEDKEVEVWTTTLVCVYTAEITANGQVITSQGDQQRVYKNNWSSPTLSILYIPVV